MVDCASSLQVLLVVGQQVSPTAATAALQQSKTDASVPRVIGQGLNSSPPFSRIWKRDLCCWIFVLYLWSYFVSDQYPIFISIVIFCCSRP